MNRRSEESSQREAEWVYSLAAATTSASVFLSDPLRRTVHRLAAPRFDSLSDRVAGIDGVQCIPSATGAPESNRTCRDGEAKQVPLYAPTGTCVKLIAIAFSSKCMSTRISI